MVCDGAACLPASLRIWDGDTFIVDRTGVASEKIRIANIDTPEIEGKCASESAAAIAAKHRLAQLVDGQSIRFHGTRLDRYSRRLATIELASGQDVGATMVGDGLARAWEGSRKPWC
ncbi:hypothetical protein BTE77_34670 [Ensifer adhaerens]|nr:hypothetical protein BTE77_34670 [Ensifer adhaerens]